MLLRWLLGVCSIRVLAKNHGDPYYEPTIVVHDISLCLAAFDEHAIKFKVNTLVREISWKVFPDYLCALLLEPGGIY